MLQWNNSYFLPFFLKIFLSILGADPTFSSEKLAVIWKIIDSQGSSVTEIPKELSNDIFTKKIAGR